MHVWSPSLAIASGEARYAWLFQVFTGAVRANCGRVHRRTRRLSGLSAPPAYQYQAGEAYGRIIFDARGSVLVRAQRRNSAVGGGPRRDPADRDIRARLLFHDERSVRHRSQGAAALFGPARIRLERAKEARHGPLPLNLWAWAGHCPLVPIGRTPSSSTHRPYGGGRR
jgi:hypothetical protein